MVRPYREAPVRCSIRNWAFFYVHRLSFSWVHEDGTKYEIYGCLFSIYIMLLGGYYNVVWRLRETDSRSCYLQENLSVIAKPHYSMNKNITLGTHSVSTPCVSAAEKIRELLNRVLPKECQVRTASDAWYVATMAATCFTLICPPAITLVGYCLHRAKKGEKGGE